MKTRRTSIIGDKQRCVVIRNPPFEPEVTVRIGASLLGTIRGKSHTTVTTPRTTATRSPYLVTAVLVHGSRLTQREASTTIRAVIIVTTVIHGQQMRIASNHDQIRDAKRRNLKPGFGRTERMETQYQQWNATCPHLVGDVPAFNRVSSPLI
jgi:hypothetical protein